MPTTEDDSLGRKSPSTVIEYLREIDDKEAADALQPPGGVGQAFGLQWVAEVWGHTVVLIGYIPPEATGRLSQIENAYTLPPDTALKGSRIKISLERFWVQR